jgi:tRNA-2-methylthio-N6-dimethylallyladenosine synthase
VLVEKVSRQGEGIVTGRSTDNTLVHFKGNAELIGQTVPVKITENKVFYLLGERI